MSDEIRNFIKQKRGVARGWAINFGEEVISGVMEGFKEPTREGTPKGDKIGFSAKKFNASLQMIFYPNCFSLKEIADRVDTTEGTLRVWRTQDDFKTAVENIEKTLAELIFSKIDRLVLRRNVDLYKWTADDDLEADHDEKKGDLEVIRAKRIDLEDRVIILHSELLKYEKEIGHFFETREKLLKSLGEGKRVIVIDDDPKKLKGTENVGDPFDAITSISELLPFYNQNILSHVIHYLVDQVKNGFPWYEMVLLQVNKAFSVLDDAGLKKWKKTPEMVYLRKTMIESYIDDLADPGAWRFFGEEGMKDIAKKLKGLIFEDED